MQVRILLAAATLSITAGTTCAQDLSLVGTWTGERQRMAKVEGYRSGAATLVITEQQGRAFRGYLSRSNKDGDVKEDLGARSLPTVI